MFRHKLKTLAFLSGSSYAYVTNDNNISDNNIKYAYDYVVETFLPTVHAHVTGKPDPINIFPGVYQRPTSPVPALPTLTSTLSLAEQAFYIDSTCAHGLPGVENIIVRRPYVASVNFKTKCPNWVAEHYTSVDIEDPNAINEGKMNRKNHTFKADVAVPAPFRATPSDYLNTGLARGHMATAASHSKREVDLMETFLLSSNIVPQNHVMNEGSWAKLEKLSRDLVNNFRHVRSVTGPLYLPSYENNELVMKYKVIGKNMVHVPTHLFKVIYLEGHKHSKTNADIINLTTRFKNVPLVDPIPLSAIDHQIPGIQNPRVVGSSDVYAIAFIIPNVEPVGEKARSIPLHLYSVPISSVETVSGLCLTPRLHTDSVTMTTSK